MRQAEFHCPGRPFRARNTEPVETGDHEYGWFSVTGVAEGECIYTVTYPDGNGGAGAEAQFSYTIEP